MNHYFEGYYYKHQKGDNMIAFIPGINEGHEFIQIISQEGSYNIPCKGKNQFSDKGIVVDIREKDVAIAGKIKYYDLTPIRYSIMGIFKYFPMECRHEIVSMHHRLEGSLNFCGKIMDFTDGVGYIEKDSGISFPKTYLWLQCNDFSEKCSVMVSIADIPFMGQAFKGCICVVYYKNKEYRLATYLGVKMIAYSENRILLRQGKLRLEIEIEKNKGHKLFAPNLGEMTRIIKESPCTKARFKFYRGDELLFDLESNHASFEFVDL